jgi:hypothetical protein
MQKAIIVTIFAVFLVALLIYFVAWIATIVSYSQMRANRTEKATFLVRLIPWWSMRDGMLTEEGLLWRRRCSRWSITLMGSVAVGAADLGLALWLHYHLGWDVSLKI